MGRPGDIPARRHVREIWALGGGGSSGLGHRSPAAASWWRRRRAATLACTAQSVFHTLLRNLTTSS